MSRKFTENELIIATHNTGKAKEFDGLLEGRVSKIYSMADFDLPAPEEDGEDFISNALIKARAAAQASGKPALADDSGLAVTALGGAPGIYSARWAGEPRDFMVAMERVNKALAEFEDRSAAFVCALALVWPDGEEAVVEARCEGQISWPPRGDNGFGYDPFFVPLGYTQSFGEMLPHQKDAISHRTKAFQKLLQQCFLSHAA